MTQEDYKPVLICVHCCQIPIYTAAMSDCIQLQIITTLLYIESMSTYSFHRSLLATPDCASLISRLAITDNIDRPIYGLSAQTQNRKFLGKNIG